MKELKKEPRVGAPGMYEDFLTSSAQTRELENIKVSNSFIVNINYLYVRSSLKRFYPPFSLEC